MKIYHFFTKGDNGRQTYGPAFYVVSKNLDYAKHAVVNSKYYQELVKEYLVDEDGSIDIEKMGVTELPINEVINAYAS